MPVNTRRRYYDAAHDILSTEGYGALKLANLCERLGQTTGAFYHKFSSWQHFTDSLLDDWWRERTELTAELVRKVTDPISQLEILLNASVSLRHGSEAAIRVWAGTDPRVGAVQLAVDEARYEVALEAMTKLVGARLASKYAWWGVNILVGFEQAPHTQTLEDFRWQLEQVLCAAVAEQTRNASTMS